MKKGDATRQRIIESAAPLFNQRGFAGCSMQDIMDAAGLEKGGLYRHFGSKEEIAIEAFKYARTAVMEARSSLVDRSAPPLVQVRQMLDAFVLKPSPVAGGCPILNTAVDADDSNAALKQLSREAFTAWRGRLRSLLERAVKNGEARADLNPTQFADVIVATLEGALVLSRLDGNRRALQNARSSLHTMLRECASAHTIAAP